MNRYADDGVDGTVWPYPWGTDDEYGVEHRLRYGTYPDLFAASCVAAYSTLVDPNITQDQAIQALKRARRAVKRLYGREAPS